MLWEFNYVIGFVIRIRFKFFYQIFSISDIPEDCAVPPVTASESHYNLTSLKFICRVTYQHQDAITTR
jgi:hypothetical protein